jgi:hypothetical protein
MAPVADSHSRADDPRIDIIDEKFSPWKPKRKPAGSCDPTGMYFDDVPAA